MVGAYDKIARAINAAKVKRRKNADTEYRKAYFDTRHSADIERQLQGKAKTASALPATRHQLEERNELQRIMCNTGRQLSEDQIKRQRLEAVNLMIRLCRRREVQQHHRPGDRPKTQQCKEEEASGMIKTEARSSARESSVDDPFPLKYEKRQCIICIGDEALAYDTRIFSFSTPSKIMDHVESHLRSVSLAKEIECPHLECRMAGGVALSGVLHFKNHVYTVHGVKLRSLPR